MAFHVKSSIRATPTGSAFPGSSAAFITSSPICSALAATRGSRPGGVRSRAKTFGIAVMMWKCFECGRMFAKISTRVECVQKPMIARIDRFSGPASSRSEAKSDPAGFG